MKVYVVVGNMDYAGGTVLGVGLKRKDANLIIRKHKRGSKEYCSCNIDYDSYSIGVHKTEEVAK